MLQVSLPRVFGRVIAKVLSLVFILSNLTFGHGGKDKDGVVTSGWGYYEVGA
jgi:hypothetical protein